MIPAGHLVVDDDLARAQFWFWSYNIWDIARSVMTGDPTHLPDRIELECRARAAGARPGMSSFTETELTGLAAAFEIYRAYRRQSLTPQDVVNTLFLPQLLQVELGFQGHGERYPARPRRDDGDKHECRMLGHCLAAHRHFSDSRPSTTDQIYRMACHRLDGLQHGHADQLIAAKYRQLVAAYNLRHPTATVPRLHVPGRAFPPSNRLVPADPPSGPTTLTLDDKDEQ
ncbi:hypothetical protein ACIQUM_33140 [Amycolatopsis azurea]|uniref:hypothetical protein n=1 Tax=Amycolatopsis azurea TaxID=36819 RepID=UPI003818CE95